MKFTCTKNSFLQGLQMGERIAGRNTTLSILQNVFIQTRESTVNIITTDLEIGISSWIPVKIQKQGSASVPVKILSSFVRTVPSLSLEITENKYILTIKSGSTVSKIKGEDPSQFPLLPKIEKVDPLIINAKEFVYGLERVLYSVSSIESKPELTGVFLKFTDRGVTYAATDSFRLAEYKYTYPEANPAYNQSLREASPVNKKIISFILPSKTAQELIYLFQQDESNSQLSIFVSSSQVLFVYTPNKDSVIPHTHIVSRMIEGDYPQYEQIIPKDHKIQLTLSKHDLLTNLKTASLFANKSHEITFRMGKDSLFIHAQDYDSGEYASSIPCTIEGEGGEKEVVFNYGYLIDGISHVESSDVVIKIVEINTPIVFEPLHLEGYKYIVMPIKKE